MAKMTLLQMVQDIASDLSTDEINSISDTVESLQIAQIINSTYFNIIDGRDWPFLYKAFQLDPTSSVSRPNYMIIPDGMENIETLNYNCRLVTDTADRWKAILYKDPDSFLEYVNLRRSDATNVIVVTDLSGIHLNIINDAAPTYFTSFDDVNVVFDSYDSAVDTTLQSAKTQCRGKEEQTFSMTDSFIPNLPAQMFSYLLNEAKSTCSLRMKQLGDQKAEQHSISQRRRMSQEAWKINKGIRYPNYGRKR